MTPCEACLVAAKNDLTGRYNAGCKACEKRMLACMPEQRREAYLEHAAKVEKSEAGE
jgi:hypothetical protein